MNPFQEKWEGCIGSSKNCSPVGSASKTLDLQQLEAWEIPQRTCFSYSDAS